MRDGPLIDSRHALTWLIRPLVKFWPVTRFIIKPGGYVPSKTRDSILTTTYLNSATDKDVLNQRKNRWDEANELVQRAKREGRELSAGEDERYTALVNEVNKADEIVSARREKLRRETAHKNLADRLAETTGVSESTIEVWAGSNSIQLSRENATLWGSDGEKAFDKLSKLNSGAYKRSFAQYLLGGQAQLGMQVGIGPKGGFSAPTTLVAMFLTLLNDLVFIRGLATKYSTPNAVSMGVVTWDTEIGEADWTQEVPASSLTEDTTPTMGKRELSPNLLTKLVKVSQSLLLASLVNLDAFLAQRLAYRFGTTEEKAFLTGNGDKKPLGIFTPDAMGIPTSRDITAASSTTVTFDDLISLKGSCKSQYQVEGVFLLSRAVVNALRTIKLASNYAWTPALSLAEEDTILDSPYFTSEYVPNTLTTGLYVAAYGDLSFYGIVDSLELQIQRLNELFTLTNQVGVKAMKSTDGMPLVAEAFSRLKLA